jgi:thioredoxin 1
LKSRNAVILGASGFLRPQIARWRLCTRRDAGESWIPGEDQEVSRNYEENQPARSDIDALAVPLLIEFGTAWCGYCMAAQPLIENALKDHPGLRHLKFEDGPGRPLGRSFRVKLWPTLIFMAHGQEVARLVRPESVGEISRALRRIADS